MPRLRRLAAATATGAAVLLVAGCSSDGGADKVPTIEAATAADSPALSRTAAGAVVPLSDSIEASIVDPTSNTVAMLTSDARTLILVPTADPGAAPRRVTLPGGTAALSAARDGVVAVPAGRAVAVVRIADGSVSTIPVDADVRSIAFLDNRNLAVGTADGDVLEVDQTGSVLHRADGLVSVDALGVTGSELIALDRRQTSVSEVDLGAGKRGMSLRAGEGATNLITDGYGRVLIADTTGGELLSLTTDPLMMHQRYPVPDSPYALAVDEKSALVWVTVTGTNEVIGYDLSTGIPVEKYRFPTVRQPNSVAVDAETGAVFVASGTGDGLQRIDVTGN